VMNYCTDIKNPSDLWASGRVKSPIIWGSGRRRGVSENLN
jgi:hypothetical protein